MEQNMIDAPNSSPNYSRPYPEGSIWKANVVDQKFVKDYNNRPQLIVTAELVGKLVNDRDADSDVIPVGRKVRVETTVRFPANADDPGAEKQLEISIRDLEKLGFEGDDLDTLHPQHKKYQDFTGRTVFLRPKYSEFNGREMLFWNLWGVFKRDLTDINKGELAKTGVAKGFKEKMAAMKADREARGGGASGERAQVERPTKEVPF